MVNCLQMSEEEMKEGEREKRLEGRIEGKMLTPKNLNIIRHFLKLVLACGTPRLMVSKDPEENRLECLMGCLCR